MAKTRVAFIGAGGIAQAHLGNLARMEDVAVTAVADVDEERARKAAAPFGARVFADHRALYDAGGFDAVYICIPPFAHTDQELIAAELGIPFFVEKPHALSMELARRVEAAVAAKSLVTAVGFQDRYLDIMGEMRAFFREHRALLIEGGWIGVMPPTPWWRRKELSGGQHVEQTIHLFDALRYLFGEVESVCAAAATGLMTDVENYNIEDASAVTLRMKNGAIAVVFSACYLKSERAGRGGITAYCPETRVEYKLRQSVTFAGEREVREVRRMNDPSFDCDRAFIEAVQSGDPSKVRSPYSDANKSLAVVLAADRSLALGGSIVPVDAAT